MARINDTSATMTFAFSTPQSAVGGFMNYATPGYGIPTIAVYDSGHNLIESYNPTFLTGGGTDSGEFLGFQEDTADISYFTLGGAYIGVTDLTIEGASPPPPNPAASRCSAWVQ